MAAPGRDGPARPGANGGKPQRRPRAETGGSRGGREKPSGPDRPRGAGGRSTDARYRSKTDANRSVANRSTADRDVPRTGTDKPVNRTKPTYRTGTDKSGYTDKPVN